MIFGIPLSKRQTTGLKNKCKNMMILFIETVFNSTVENIKSNAKLSKYSVAVLTDKKDKDFHPDVKVIYTDFSKEDEIKKSLEEYKNKFVAVTCRREGNIPDFIKAIPFLENVPTPSVESLIAATNKAKMRSKFNSYDTSISPNNASVSVEDSIESILEKREATSDFPVIVKPTGMHASLLVTVVNNEDEFIDAVNEIKNHPKSKVANAKIMIEEFFEGDLYSTDAYVNSRGEVFITPYVYVITARKAGKDDLYGYARYLPSNLSESEIADADALSKKGIAALGLRSTSTHVELLKRGSEWKLVEIGPRLGGFRNQMYRDAFQINHEINDILIRMDENPEIPKESSNSIAVLQRYAQKEGVLKKIVGINEIKNLPSFSSIKIKNEPGDTLTFARHGGISPINIILIHKDANQVKIDSEKIDSLLEFIIE